MHLIPNTNKSNVKVLMRCKKANSSVFVILLLQLPATIFNVSGRNSKYDRSLFQRLEEAGHEVHLLNTQYRMHPAISDFPRHIFYDGKLIDGSNVKHPEYGNPLKRAIFRKFKSFQVSASNYPFQCCILIIHFTQLQLQYEPLIYSRHSLSWT